MQCQRTRQTIGSMRMHGRTLFPCQWASAEGVEEEGATSAVAVVAVGVVVVDWKET
jgi:hypothetical protein